MSTLDRTQQFDAAAASLSELVGKPLDDLPTPPELANAIQRYCERRGVPRWRRKSVEWDIKMQFHFTGKDILYVKTERGPMVIIAGYVEDDAFGQEYRRLSPEVRQRAVFYSVRPWDTNQTRLPSPLDQ